MPPPTPTSPGALLAYGARREYNTDIVACGNLLHEEVVLANIHVEVVEATNIEIQTLLEAESIARSGVCLATNSRGEPCNRVVELILAEYEIHKTVLSLHSAITQNNISVEETLDKK